MRIDADKIHDKAIAELVKARKAKGLSHESLAQLAGITRPAVSFIESGSRKPSLLIFIKLCKALELKPSELLKY